jgi:hypothetical protein
VRRDARRRTPDERRSDIAGSNELDGRTIVGCAATFIGAVALGLLAIIVLMAAIGIREAHAQARLMRNAVEVDATIVSSEVRRDSSGGQMTRSGTRPRTTIYVPEVRFRFELDGRTFDGERLFPAPRSGDQTWASRLVGKYPADRAVTAWVDPARPDAAFLEREWVLGPYAAILAAAFGLGVLTAIVSAVTFIVPRVSRGVALAGCVGCAAGVAYAAAHYWTHARADGAGGGVAEIIGGLAILGAVLPLLGRLQAGRWHRKIQGQGTAPPSGIDDDGDEWIEV